MGISPCSTLQRCREQVRSQCPGSTSPSPGLSTPSWQTLWRSSSSNTTSISSPPDPQCQDHHHQHPADRASQVSAQHNCTVLHNYRKLFSVQSTTTTTMSPTTTTIIGGHRVKLTPGD